MRQRIPGWRIASDQQAVQHGEQSDCSDSRRAIEIHGAAALSRDLGEAQIERGSGRGRKHGWYGCVGLLLCEWLVRYAMNRFDVRPWHVLLAQPVRAAVPPHLA